MMVLRTARALGFARINGGDNELSVCCRIADTTHHCNGPCQQQHQGQWWGWWRWWWRWSRDQTQEFGLVGRRISILCYLLNPRYDNDNDNKRQWVLLLNTRSGKTRVVSLPPPCWDRSGQIEFHFSVNPLVQPPYLELHLCLGQMESIRNTSKFLFLLSPLEIAE